MELTPEERGRIEAIRDEIGPGHPYLVHGFRGEFASKDKAKAERQKIASAALSWEKLDHRTRALVRTLLAHEMLDRLADGSNEELAAVVRDMDDEQRVRTVAELSEDAVFEKTVDGRFELTDGFVDESVKHDWKDGLGAKALNELEERKSVNELIAERRQRRLDPATILARCGELLLLPKGAIEEIPNLRRLARELYAAWRREQLPGTAKLPKEAIEAVANEVQRLYGLPPDEAKRRSRNALFELDRNDDLP